MKAERWLARLLRVEGSVMLLATFAVFFPDSWMAAGHRLAGLLPEILTPAVVGVVVLALLPRLPANEA